MEQVAEIDGSEGESGGQVLRTALSLSAVLGVPFKMTNIRAGRPKPGLQAQHLTAVNACATMCGARVQGAELHSAELSFSPGSLQAGNYHFEVGTAGSTILVLQTLLPLCWFSGSECKIVVGGGTENAFAPTSLYFQHVFVPAVEAMGLSVDFQVEQFGWFPKGGGRIVAKTSPCKPTAFRSLKRGNLESLLGVCVSSGLPQSVRQRMKVSALAGLVEKRVNAKFSELEAPAASPGAELMLVARFASGVAGFSSLGEKGKPSEKVAEQGVRDFLDFDKSGACVDLHLADQLLLYCALAKGKSEFVAQAASSHLRTNASTIQKFVPDCRISVSDYQGDTAMVSVEGVGTG